MDNNHLQRIKSLITEQTGLRILDEQENSFQRLIQNRMRAFKLASEIDYYQLLQRLNQAELASEHEQLSLELTTGETYFFRDQGQIDLLQQHILPELIARNRATRRLRIWSAGCSSGEEAYSLAMLLDEVNEDLSNWQISILGTDINPTVLAKARHAHYSDWSFRQVSEQRKQRYFQFTHSTWTVNPPIRQRVNFRQLNLVTEFFPNTDICLMDLILCRNVFIYLEASAVSQIANKMTDTLVEGGYLMTGHGELYAHPLGRLRTRVFPDSIVYQKTNLLHHQPPPQTISTAPLPVSASKPQIIPAKTPPLIRPSVVKPLVVPSVIMQEAWDYANQGRPEQARTYCEQLSTQNPLDHHPYYLSALLVQEQDKPEEAKALLKKVLYLAPNFIAAYLELGDIYAKESNRALAQKMWNSAHKLLQQLPQNVPVEMFGTSTATDILKFIEHRLSGLNGLNGLNG